MYLEKRLTCTCRNHSQERWLNNIILVEKAQIPDSIACNPRLFRNTYMYLLICRIFLLGHLLMKELIVNVGTGSTPPPFPPSIDWAGGGVWMGRRCQVKSVQSFFIYWKKHGNEADFLGFLQMSHVYLNADFETDLFIIKVSKSTLYYLLWLPVYCISLIRGYNTRSHRLSLSMGTSESTSHLLTDTESFLYKKFSRQLPVSVIRGVGNLLYHRYGESATLWINDTRSRRFPVSTIRGVDFRLWIYSWIQSQNRKGLNRCVRDLGRTDLYTKNRKIGLIALSLSTMRISYSYTFQRLLKSFFVEKLIL